MKLDNRLILILIAVVRIYAIFLFDKVIKLQKKIK